MRLALRILLNFARARAEMRLIDFGCAKEVKDTDVIKDMAGTPYYISVQQHSPSDVWDCGSYELCTHIMFGFLALFQPEVLDPKFVRTGKV